MKDKRHIENNRHREGELHGELDRIVIEAIENIVHTSRRLQGVRQRRRDGKFQQKLEDNEIRGNVTRLHAKCPDRRSSSLGKSEEGPDSQTASDIDEDAFELPGLTHKQRERAENFSEWLMQQDNYPLILQHVEELLSPFEEEPWPDDSGVEKNELDPEMIHESSEMVNKRSMEEAGHAADAQDLEQAEKSSQLEQSAEISSISETTPGDQSVETGDTRSVGPPLTPGQPHGSEE